MLHGISEQQCCMTFVVHLALATLCRTNKNGYGQSECYQGSALKPKTFPSGHIALDSASFANLVKTANRSAVSRRYDAFQTFVAHGDLPMNRDNSYADALEWIAELNVPRWRLDIESIVSEIHFFVLSTVHFNIIALDHTKKSEEHRVRW